MEDMSAGPKRKGFSVWLIMSVSDSRRRVKAVHFEHQHALYTGGSSDPTHYYHLAPFYITC